MGTGLGLWVCKKLAEQHGGRMQIESSHGNGMKAPSSLFFYPARNQHPERAMLESPLGAKPITTEQVIRA